MHYVPTMVECAVVWWCAVKVASVGAAQVAHWKKKESQRLLRLRFALLCFCFFPFLL